MVISSDVDAPALIRLGRNVNVPVQWLAHVVTPVPTGSERARRRALATPTGITRSDTPTVAITTTVLRIM
jgi:hypothetical protein